MASSTTQDLAALVPELWANESLMILEEEMVMGNLVHRDFEDEVAQYGETVHTRQPGTFTAQRKRLQDEVEPADAVATDVPVVLNQHIYTSFHIRDGEMTKSFKDLVRLYLQPSMIANAHFLDACLAGEAANFLGNVVGEQNRITGGSSQNVQEFMVDARRKMNENKVPVAGRNMVWASRSEAAALNTDLFVSANKVGDGGRALREAELGRKFGFQNYMDLNIPDNSFAVADATGDTADGIHLKGTTALQLQTGGTAAGGFVVGQYTHTVGDYQPRRIGTIATDLLTLDRVSLGDIADNAVVSTYEEWDVALTEHTAADSTVTAYPAGWGKKIYIDGGDTTSMVPQVGQLFAFGDPDTDVNEYTIIAVEEVTEFTAYYITLNRPLGLAITDGEIACPGPVVDLNFGFHRNALALVSRPLAHPMVGAGALSAVASHNGMSMRVCITYEGRKQGHLVTVDSLFGTAKLNEALGCVMLG